MRADTQDFGGLNAAKIKDMRFVVVLWFDAAGTDKVHITSHSDIAVPSPSLTATIKELSVTSQKLNPDTANATIGNISFSVVDKARELTDLQRTKLLAGKGLRDKRVEVYVGFSQLPFDAFRLVATQIIENVEYASGSYDISCNDVQRFARKDIFEAKTTILANTLTATATTVEVVSTSGFQRIAHGPSFSDAPNQTVGYLKVDKEIIRYTGLSAGQFTGCTRGCFGTRAEAHTADSNGDNGKKVEEVIYLELPAPKLAYALLSGYLWNQGGAQLPAHWHLGVPAQYVRASDFTSIGTDWYDTADDTKGVILRFDTLKKTDGKRFLETQVCLPLGAYMPIYADGAIGMKRMAGVLSGSSYQTVLDENCVTKVGALEHGMSATLNDFDIQWNQFDNEYLRRTAVVDADSVSKHGKAARKTVQFSGLHSARHTATVVANMLNSLRDRYAGPPLRLKVDVLPSRNFLEVGDHVRVRLKNVRDYTNASTTDLDRTMEVQAVTLDWVRGRVSLELFGSSQPAGPLPPIASETALPDSFYATAGTNLASLPGATTSGGITTLTQNVTLTGNTALGGAVYYCANDLVIANGVTVTITQNVMLRVKGFLTLNGTINGKGNGIAGIAGNTTMWDGTWSNVPTDAGYGKPLSLATTPGTQGFFGKTKAHGGLAERMNQKGGSSSKYYYAIQSVEATVTSGKYETVPYFQLSWNGTALTGLPTDLRGTSGGPGGMRYWNDVGTGPSTSKTAGGSGGAGGAGLCVIARGMGFGVSGTINTSGADGGAPIKSSGDEHPAWSGGGAGGAPGAVLVIIDGGLNPAPSMAGHIVADNGATPMPPDGQYTPLDEPFLTSVGKGWARFGIGITEFRMSSDEAILSGYPNGVAASRVQYLLPPSSQVATPDQSEEDIAASQAITLTVTESYELVADPSTTALIVKVAPNPGPSFNATYSHANIYYRVVGAAVWTFAGPAEPERAITVPAIGTSYEFKAVPVSVAGVEGSNAVLVTHSSTGASGDSETVYVQPTQPTGVERDIWIDTSANYLIRTYTRTAPGTWANSKIPEFAWTPTPNSPRGRAVVDGLRATTAQTGRVFSEDFDDPASVQQWRENGGTYELSVVTDAEVTNGGRVLKIGDNSGNDTSWLTHARNIPFDPSKLYRIRARVKRTAGTGQLYVGVAGVAADGLTFVATDGTASASGQHYVCANSVNPSATFVEYVGYLKGHGAPGTGGACPSWSSPGRLHQNARYIRPILIGNYYNTPGITLVDYIRIEEVALDAQGRPSEQFTGDLNSTNGADSTNLKIGTSGNGLKNASLVLGTTLWGVGYSGSGYSFFWNPYPEHQPAGGNYVSIYAPSVNPGTYAEWIGSRIPVKPGDRVEASAYVQNYNTTVVAVDVVWWNASGGYVSEARAGSTGPYALGPGASLANWLRIGGFVTAPASAATAEFRLRRHEQLSASPPYSHAFMTMPFMARALPAQTELTPWGVGVLDGAIAEGVMFSDAQAGSVAERASRIKRNGRVVDLRFLTQPMVNGVSAARSTITITTTYSGSGTINIPAHTITGDWGTLSYNAGSITGLAASTTYYVYGYDPDFLGGAISYFASTSYIDPASNGGRLYYGKVVTPNTSGGGGGPTNPGDWCVALNMYVSDDRQAVSVRGGVELMVLDYDTMSSWATRAVDNMETGLATCVELETESGIRLTVSVETPLTGPGGADDVVPAKHGLGRSVPVLDQGEFRWEKVTAVRPAGDWFVAHIHMGGATYAAGKTPGRYIFTHNPIQKP